MTRYLDARTGLCVPEETNAPRNLRAAVRDRSVDLMWDPPAQLNRATGFVVEVGSAPGLADVARETTTSLRATVPLVREGRYFVRVKTMTTRGERLSSNEIAVIVGRALRPV